MRKQVAFVVGPAVIPAKAGIQYAAACRLIIGSSAILDRPPSRAMTRRVTFACARIRKRFAFVAATTRQVSHTSAFSRRECARVVQEVRPRRAWGMPGADAPAASHAK